MKSEKSDQTPDVSNETTRHVVTLLISGLFGLIFVGATAGVLFGIDPLAVDEDEGADNGTIEFVSLKSSGSLTNLPFFFQILY